LIPRWFSLHSERHKDELARGYTMNSPHERPVHVGQLRHLSEDAFLVEEVRGWHLHSLGFAMQVTALKDDSIRRYEWLVPSLYRLDAFLLRCIGWEAFSFPGRFIMCSLKLVRK
jgi:hypothetical protein